MSELDLTSKIYRYEALLQAINFFTQRFDIDQVCSYAFDFANEMLTLNSSALFVLESEKYVLKKQKLYGVQSYEINCSKALCELPLFHGDIVVSNHSCFFDDDDIKAFNISLVIPLMINDFLKGFIVSDGKAVGQFNSDDAIIASALAKLFGNSLENNTNIFNLQMKNKQLDQKIFNLFAINQSAKSILSELDLQKLYNLATDVFSEITCSRVTCLGIYDKFSGTIKILGYRNVSNYSRYFTEIKLKNPSYNGKIVLDFENDIDIIMDTFENWEEFRLLEAKHIILLVKESVLGIVTLSSPVNDMCYDSSLFELVESLASFAHIAISNSLLFEDIEMQKNEIQKKYSLLKNLNSIIKNINSCRTIDELCSITLKTLRINFGIDRAFFAMHKDGAYSIAYCEGFNGCGLSVEINPQWENSLSGSMLYDFSIDGAKKYLSEDVLCALKSYNCIAISPIHMDSWLSRSSDERPLGFLVAANAPGGLKDEDLLLIDTIASNISPLVYQMNRLALMDTTHIEDPHLLLLDALNQKIFERDEYSVNFHLYCRPADLNPFKQTEFEGVDGFEHYILSGYIFLLGYDRLEMEQFREIALPDGIDSLYSFDFN